MLMVSQHNRSKASHEHSTYAKATFDMWGYLKKRYSVANASNMHRLKAGIANCKQGTLDIREFYKLLNLWNELNNHIKVPFCTFKGCKCGAAPKIVKMYGEDKSHQFLMGVNDYQFSQIHSQILAQEPLPNLDKIFNMVMQKRIING